MQEAAVGWTEPGEAGDDGSGKLALKKKRIPVALKPCESGNLSRLSSSPIEPTLIPKLGPGEDEERRTLDDVG